LSHYMQEASQRLTPLPSTSRPLCKICGSETEPAGSKTGTFRRETFVFRRCPSCRFTFITNPWLDYENIYSADYYAGKGADPLVDYEFELDHPEETIRLYEWRGISAVVGSLTRVEPATTWLDFGCGNGGLVRYCRSRGLQQTFGFEHGAIRDKAARLGVPFLDESELEQRAGAFDVITAIEVLEHLEDPLETLRFLRRLLKPDGLLFLTTGNAAPFAANFLQWKYVVPEVHMSFYEPETLRRALIQAGFRPYFPGYLPGFTDIIRFKILKNLGVKRRSAWHNFLPWALLAHLADSRYRITALPSAHASAGDGE
jgi:SAM-dependent methyltransferase